MATVHAYTPDGIYYECAANGKKYTGEEWHAYCAANKNTDFVVAEYFGFKWNVYDVCINAHITDIFFESWNYCLQIKTAQRKDETWTYGYNYRDITDCGESGGCGCWYDGTTYKTEEDAILANLEWFKTQKNNAPKIQNAINKAIFDRKCKQLTLF
jgi:hypothetical protein